MCLTITNRNKRRTTKTNVSCFKILNYNSYGEYFTPFQRCKIDIGGEYFSNLRTSGFLNTKVEIGIHSFVRLKDAKRIISTHDGLSNCVIIKCYIPSGSEYYQGLFKVIDDFDYPCYTSTAIKYVEELPLN